MPSGRRPAFVWVIAALAVAFVLSVVPTPYVLLTPGAAVDLANRVVAEGAPAAHRRYYLTDVAVARASALLLAARVLPTTKIVRGDALVPATESRAQYDRILADAMTDSQNVAALVAERAAGYRVPDPPRRVVIVGLPALSPAAPALRVGDTLAQVEGRPTAGLDDVSAALAQLGPRVVARVVVERAGRRFQLAVPTVATPQGRRFGVLVRAAVLRPDLPVPVRFDLGDVAGSSGGLMFALQLYAELHGDADLRPHTIAGTGTIAPDGTVGRIEGTPQKFAAARRAGADVFLVPAANVGDIAREPGPRIIAVTSFAQALRRLRTLR